MNLQSADSACPHRRSLELTERFPLIGLMPIRRLRAEIHLDDAIFISEHSQPLDIGRAERRIYEHHGHVILAPPRQSVRQFGQE